jgi:hypothetical protein
MGNCGLRRAMGGAVAEGASQPPPPPPPQPNNNRQLKINQLIITFFLQSMDVAPATAEVAVMTGAVVQGVCVQQYAAVVAWVWQRAACVGGAAGGGGWGHDRNGWQAASVRVTVGSGCGVHATACRGAACVRQCAVAAACVWQRVRAASSTIAMKQ